jgi:hypothetical protein
MVLLPHVGKNVPLLENAWCLLSFFQAKDKIFPQSGHAESAIQIYVTVQLGLYILPNKPVYAPESDWLPPCRCRQYVLPKHCTIPLLQRVKTKKKKKEVKRKKTSPFEKQPWWKFETLNTSQNTSSEMIHKPTSSNMFPNRTTVSLHATSEGDRHCVLYDEKCHRNKFNFSSTQI